jgi:MFS transporter, DHA2 family, multidrug resistance protein
MDTHFLRHLHHCTRAPAVPIRVPPVEETLLRYRWVILIGLVLAAIMEVLDTTIINVALPTMAGNLGSTTDEIGWVSTSYILANVVVLPMTAWLSQRFGNKRYLIASIVGFLAASVLCGLSRSLGQIVVWRLFQGASGAALISMTQATLYQVFPKSQQALALGIWGLGIMAAPTVAPALGGWITDNYSWPWIFYVNVPIALMAAALISGCLPAAKPQDTERKVDWTGIGLLAIGLASLQYVLEEGNRNDWFGDTLILRLTIAGVIGTALFVLWELWPVNCDPIVDLRVLKDRGLAAGIILNVVLGFGLYAGLFLFPIFAQSALGFTATKTGIVLLPGGASIGFGMVYSGIVLGKGAQPRNLIIFGMIVFIYSQWMMGHFSPQSGEYDSAVGLLVRGFGMGFLFIPISAAALADLKGPAIQEGSALTGLARQLGGSFGIAAASTYVTRMTAFHRYDLVASLYSGSQALSERQQGIAYQLIGKGYSPPDATAAAMRVIDHTVQGQAFVMSINDAYLLIGLVFLIAFPAVFLLKRVKAGAPVSMGH